MTCDQTEKELSSEELKNFEKQLYVKLPQSFVNHYLEHNGGYPPFEYVKGRKNIFSVNGFIPIKYGRVPIDRVIKDYKTSDVTFGEKIPFAYDNERNIFLLILEKENYGKVVIVESQFINEKDIKFVEVADSFEDFLNRLTNET